MILNCDKFFVEELQKYGYDIDYKKIMDIYKASRNSEGFKKDKLKRKRIYWITKAYYWIL